MEAAQEEAPAAVTAVELGVAELVVEELVVEELAVEEPAAAEPEAVEPVVDPVAALAAAVTDPAQSRRAGRSTAPATP